MNAIMKAPNRLRGDERGALERLREKQKIVCESEEKRQRRVRQDKARMARKSRTMRSWSG